MTDHNSANDDTPTDLKAAALRPDHFLSRQISCLDDY